MGGRDIKRWPARKIIRNRREVLNARSPAYELHNASDELKADREVVLAAIQDSGRPLHYASDELKADREIVLTAMNADQIDIVGIAFPVGLPER